MMSSFWIYWRNSQIDENQKKLMRTTFGWFQMHKSAYFRWENNDELSNARILHRSSSQINFIFIYLYSYLFLIFGRQESISIGAWTTKNSLLIYIPEKKRTRTTNWIFLFFESSWKEESDIEEVELEERCEEEDEDEEEKGEEEKENEQDPCFFEAARWEEEEEE